jgi:serine/threonine protein kinase/tetratricopeptide (TPR) repeat protein
MIGKTISHYRITRELGAGGMGVVYEAVDTKLDRTVALKFLPPESTRNPDAKARFVHEAKAASALDHPNVCTVYEIDETDDGQLFLAMARYEGETLKERIDRGPLPLDDAMDITRQVAEGLTKAHERDIVHRDIKPANIFITEDGLVKILDFGLAKLEGQTLLTKTGTTLGTASYMSPELARGDATDHRTDLWCLGVVLYEMVTGRRPFLGDHEQAIVYAILNKDPDPISGLRTGVSLELEQIVNKALEKDVEMRYQSAAELRGDLRRLQRDSSTDRIAVSLPPDTAGSGGRWVRLLGVAGVLLLLVVTVQMLKGLTARDTIPADISPGSQIDARATQVSSRGPTIDVLPFTNTSGDAGQKYFSDGLTEDIVTELSRFQELTVIAYSSTEQYEDSRFDIHEIGALPVTRYLLKGSVRTAEQQVRVTVQLSDSGDGRLVWRKKYERDLTARDLFELQDELAQQVVNAIAGSYGALTRAQLPGARRKPPASLDSYDCVLRTYEYLHVHTSAKHLAARDCLEHVIKGDSDYADGLAWLAYLYAEEYHHRWNERKDEYDALERALVLAEEAVRLDTANHVAHGVLALTHFFNGEYERAKVEAYRTIDLNPNDTLWLSLLGYLLAQQEDFEHGLPMLRKVITIDPHPPDWIRVPFVYDHYQHGRYEQALSELRGLDRGDDFRGPLDLAAVYGQLGRPEDAEQELDEMRALWSRPVGEIRRELIERHALSVALTDHLLEGLAKAGLEGVVDTSVGDKASDD